MRPLSANDRLQGFSLPEVVHAFEREALELQLRLKFNHRKLKPGAVLNALAIWFVEKMDDEQRYEAIKYGLRRLESLQESDAESPLARGGGPGPAPGTSGRRRDKKK